MKRTIRFLGLVVLISTLSGCLNIGGDTKPVTLFRLSTTLPAAENSEPIVLKLSITSGSLLNSQRLWVFQAGGQVAGFAGARWAMPLPELFQQTLIGALEQSGSCIVVEPPGRAPTLRIAIRDFQINSSGAESRAVVAIKASWMNIEGQVQHQLFQATAAASLANAQSVANAMDNANQVMLRELQSWLLDIAEE